MAGEEALLLRFNGPLKHKSHVVTSPAAPTSGQTIVLWSSVASLGAYRMRRLGLSMVEISWLRLNQASATLGLIAQASRNGGTNWYKLSMPDNDGVASMPATVSALAADTNSNYKFEVSGFDDFKVEFTAGGTAPTNWDPIIVLHFDRDAVLK